MRLLRILRRSQRTETECGIILGAPYTTKRCGGADLIYEILNSEFALSLYFCRCAIILYDVILPGLATEYPQETKENQATADLIAESGSAWLLLLIFSPFSVGKPVAESAVTF